jgi:hypothetical protein
MAFMVEHLAKVVAIHPPAARRTSIKMLGFVSGRTGVFTKRLRKILTGYGTPTLSFGLER